MKSLSFIETNDTHLVSFVQYPVGGLPHGYRSDLIKIMKPHEIRRINLQRIIATRFDGKAGRLADFVGKKRPQIYRLFSDSENSRDIGEELARDIENKLGLPFGNLDLEAPEDGESQHIAQRYKTSGEGKRDAMKALSELPEEAAADIRPILDALKAKYKLQ